MAKPGKVQSTCRRTRCASYAARPRALRLKLLLENTYASACVYMKRVSTSVHVAVVAQNFLPDLAWRVPCTAPVRRCVALVRGCVACPNHRNLFLQCIPTKKESSQAPRVCSATVTLRGMFWVCAKYMRCMSRVRGEPNLPGTVPQVPPICLHTHNVNVIHGRWWFVHTVGDGCIMCGYAAGHFDSTNVVQTLYTSVVVCGGTPITVQITFVSPWEEIRGFLGGYWVSTQR